MSKYDPPTLPTDAMQALDWATDREIWARAARQQDKHGSAYEFELTALLLRDWAARGSSNEDK